MAKSKLVACKACGQMVSIYTDKCPGCGQPRTREFTPAEQGGCVVVLGFMAVCMFLWLGPCTSATHRTPKPLGGASDDGSGAKAMAPEFVKKHLVAPSTAKFPWLAGTAVRDGDWWRVRSYVDSQNAFGAMIRNNYECVLREKGDGMWECSYVQIGGEVVYNKRW